MISEIMSQNSLQQQMETEVRICCIIQVKMWPIENKVCTRAHLTHKLQYANSTGAAFHNIAY